MGEIRKMTGEAEKLTGRREALMARKTVPSYIFSTNNAPHPSKFVAGKSQVVESTERGGRYELRVG